MAEDLDVGGIRDRATIVNLNAYWLDYRMTYDASGNLIYRAVTHYHNEPTSSTRWEVWKYTWGSDGISRTEGPLQGSVDGQAALGWG